MSVFFEKKRTNSSLVTLAGCGLGLKPQMPVRPTINITPFSLLLSNVARQFKMEAPFRNALSEAFRNEHRPITFVVVDIENRPDVQRDVRFMNVMGDTTHKFILTASTPTRTLKLKKKLPYDANNLFFFANLTQVKDAADVHLAMLTQAMFMLSQYRKRRLDRFVIFSNDHMFQTVAESIRTEQQQIVDVPSSATIGPSVHLCEGPARAAEPRQVNKK